MITIDFKRLRIFPGDRVLDMGCGSGRHVSGACADYEAFVVGADCSVDDLVQAKGNIFLHEQYGAPFRGRWTLSAADITCLPFAGNTFDHVICAEVLEHIPDDRKAASELNRVLKPGGSLTVSVPRFFPETICWKLSATYSNTPGGHVRIYKKARVISLFEKRGLTRRFFHHSHGIHTPYWWLRCLAGPENENSLPVVLFKRLLEWDIMKKPRIIRLLDRLLTPVMGKSLVVYFRKPGG